MIDWFSSKTWKWWTRHGIGIGQLLSVTTALAAKVNPNDISGMGFALLALIVSGSVALVCVIDENAS